MIIGGSVITEELYVEYIDVNQGFKKLLHILGYCSVRRVGASY